MINPFTPLLSTLGRLRRDKSGAAVMFVAAGLVTTLGSAAFVIDLGNATVARRALQASTDASALAGAADINCCKDAAGTAVATAQRFSAKPGGANASARMAVTIAPGFPQLKCLASTGVSCTGPDSANAIVVRQTATVPMNFAKVFGISTLDIVATSTAAANAGKPKPLDVMLLLDMTGSMNNADPSCTIGGKKRLDCAINGAYTLMAQLSPSANKIGLMTYPGAASAAEQAKAYNCSNDTPTPVAYNAKPVYLTIGLSNDFRAKDGDKNPDTSSNIVKALRGGASGCKQGITAQGGVGTYFADAITAAQNELVTTGRTDVQKVLIILSDGDAGAEAKYIDATKYQNQCKQAVTAANSAAATGTWVYSIAFGAPTVGKPTSCPTELVILSACDTMRTIASDPAKFYSNKIGGSTCNSAANAVSDLTGVFSSIVESFKGSRLIPDNTI